ncbi:hypothetical protein SBDP2_330002 [Syntrophobacter sp. SbD2]|nr:hypothetical protein SBDP2_330002 [Syntrophobacter sp. SbD2]
MAKKLDQFEKEIGSKISSVERSAANAVRDLEDMTRDYDSFIDERSLPHNYQTTSRRGPKASIQQGLPGQIDRNLQDFKSMIEYIREQSPSGLFDLLTDTARMESGELSERQKGAMGDIEKLFEQQRKNLNHVRRQIEFGSLAIMADYQCRARVGGQAANAGSEQANGVSGIDALKRRTEALGTFVQILVGKLKSLQDALK